MPKVDIWRLALRCALAGYAAALAGLALLWRAGSSRWWAQVARIFAPHLFWPLAALGPLALRSGDRVAQLAACVPAALLAGMYGRRALPRRPVAAAGQPLRVATCNLCFRNQDTGAIVAALGALRADIVMVQELTPPVALALAQLGGQYPHQLLHAAERQNGMGIISRLPLREASFDADARIQRASASLGHRQITLINAHPTIADMRWRRLLGRFPLLVGYAPGRRQHDIDALLAQIDRAEGDLVVAGDFNTAEGEPPYRQLAARLRDSFAEAGRGFGFTFPLGTGGAALPQPLIRIDYVWVRGAIRPLRAAVCRRSGGSDHAAVVADLLVVEG